MRLPADRAASPGRLPNAAPVTPAPKRPLPVILGGGAPCGRGGPCPGRRRGGRGTGPRCRGGPRLGAEGGRGAAPRPPRGRAAPTALTDTCTTPRLGEAIAESAAVLRSRQRPSM